MRSWLVAQIAGNVRLLDIRSLFAMCGDRLGFTIELVPHLFGASQRPTGQRGLLALWRTGSAVVVPNALRYMEVK